MARVLTPEAEAYLLKNPKAGSRFQAALKNRLSTKDPSQKKRTLFREGFTSAANDFLRKEQGIDFDWFELDVAKGFPKQYLRKEVSQINAGVFESLAKQFARPMKKGDVPLEELLAGAPVYRFGKQNIGGDPEAVASALERVGKGGRGVPPEVAEAAFDLSGKMGKVEEIAPLLDIYDKGLGILRFSLTAPWPAFHNRNTVTNIVMNWLGGVSNPKFYKNAFKALADPAQALELKKAGVLRGGQVDDIIRELGGKPAAGVPEKVLGRIARKFGKVSELVENWGRTAHYLGKRSEGLSKLEAVQSVNKFLFDYGDITRLEKQVGKRTVMFYQWARKILPLLLGQYVENPGKMAALTRSVAQPSAEREPLPGYLRKSLAIPFGRGGKGQKYLTGVGLPVEEFSKYDITRSPGAVGMATSLGQSLTSQLAAPIKGAAELISGRDFYLDKPLLEADRAPTSFRFLPDAIKRAISFKKETSPSGHVSYRADPLALWLLKQTPFSRLASTTGKAADPRKGVGEKLLNLLTGVRTTTVDRDVANVEAEKISLEHLLSEAVRKGDAGKFSGFYARGQGEEKDPETLRLMKLLRALGKKRKAMAAERR
jgi:hypothetical protein